MKPESETRDEKQETKWVLDFLHWFCPPALYEGIEGDLLEAYEKDLAAVGKSDPFAVRRAQRNLIINALRFFRPGIILRNKFSNQLFSTIMVRNYLTIAFRNLTKNKVFSAINIFGLGIGLAACLLIFQFVSFELSYDKFNEKYDRTYRVTNDRFQNGKLIQHGTIMYPTIGPTMAKDYPEIEEFARIMPAGELNVKAEDRYFRGDQALWADDRLLSVFSFRLIAGQRSELLKKQHTIVLSEAVARKYFEIKDNDFTRVLDKVIYVGLDPQPYSVTGVLENIPENSHLYFNALLSYETLISESNDADVSWTWSDMRHYLVLKPGTDYKHLESKFDAFSERYFKGDKVSGSVEKFYLQPLSRAHLYSNYEYDIARTVNGKAVWAMLVVAVFILVIAWINYINLTTSRAIERAKEVGLRKVMGAMRTQLVNQFVFESIVVSFLAFTVALILVQVAQLPFNAMVTRQLSLLQVLAAIDTKTILFLVGVMLAGVLLSGFYPAFVLSSYQPVTVLKGKFQRSSKGNMLRKSLVVFQFTTSVALITGTLIVSKQLKFMNEADLGLQIRNILIVRGPERTSYDSTYIGRVESYKHEVGQIQKVVGVATSSRLPGDRLGRAFGIRLSDQPSSTHYTLSNLGVDYSFFDTYNVKLLAGRKFLPSDHKADFGEITTVIINENSVALLGIPDAQSAIGKEIVWGTTDKNEDRKYTIIGVIANFHQESLKIPMEPMMFRPVYNPYGAASIKLAAGESGQEIVPQVEAIFKKYFPGNSFEYFFMEDRYNRQYRDDNRFGNVITIFTILAIIVSCLGLIGLSSYTALQRTKEIGIRKVLGASMASIVALLSVDFVKLIVLATVIAIPLAWYSMNDWLQAYAYRVSVGWFVFLLPALLILIIAALTMSFQVLKTARTNPAETLKYE